MRGRGRRVSCTQWEHPSGGDYATDLCRSCQHDWVSHSGWRSAGSCSCCECALFVSEARWAEHRAGLVELRDELNVNGSSESS